MWSRLFGRFQPNADSNEPQLKVGICAMNKKARSKPMVRILDRLMAFGEFEIIHFGDDVILNQPIEAWPRCDCLVSWHSDGFPLKKAQAYVALRKTHTINDLSMQDVLLDRRLVYRKLKEHNIPVPTHIIVERDGLPEGSDPEGFVEDPDYVQFNGQRINKPFVEKPCDGENHNIYIYYPASMGGGVKRLFRKVDNKSSQYDATHPGTIRRDGTYIIEEFLATGGTDVKVYTVGQSYAHAEARKSPVVDGKVLRTPDGKEMRFPVLLSPQEKDIAFRVVQAFGQKVCGFDLLRTTSTDGVGVSFVCDVNGWSFVKNSKRYLDDAAGILRSIIMSMVAPHRLAAEPVPRLVGGAESSLCTLGLADDDAHVMKNDLGSMDGIEADIPGLDFEEAQRTEDRSATEELRCVLAIIRHGDRTPKQKMKMKVTDPALLALFNKHKDAKGKQAKLKTPLQLQELYDTTMRLLTRLEEEEDGGGDNASDAGGISGGGGGQMETREKLRIIKTVLQQGGGVFAGVNRKAQLKPLRWRMQPTAEQPQGNSAPADGSATGQKPENATPPSSSSGATGTAAGAADAPPAGAKMVPVLEEALLILKWGGVLTHAGRQQAEDLGRVFRMVMYPRYGSAGGGLLRLHSTYRHDLKIYSSDEGRVQVSAAAFAKGLLDLEGTSLTPILVSLVNKDVDMLEAFGKGASEDIKDAKRVVYSAMTWDPDGAAAAAFKAPDPVLPGMPDVSSPSRSAMTDTAEAHQDRFPTAAAQAFAGTPSPTAPEPRLKENDDAAVVAANAALAREHIAVYPEKPQQLLRELDALLKQLVAQVRELCLTAAIDGMNYSSLSQDASEWELDGGRPCGGEQMLLMFDRWKKLSKSFYDEKKERFDISKVPDIYDCAKYDAIHNRHLLRGEVSTLKQVHALAKTLADAVIPNEYGVGPQNKLKIASTICGELLGKLVMDMAAMRTESLAVSCAAGDAGPRADVLAARIGAGSPPPRLRCDDERLGAIAAATAAAMDSDGSTRAPHRRPSGGGSAVAAGKNSLVAAASDLRDSARGALRSVAQSVGDALPLHSRLSSNSGEARKENPTSAEAERSSARRSDGGAAAPAGTHSRHRDGVRKSDNSSRSGGGRSSEAGGCSGGGGDSGDGGANGGGAAPAPAPGDADGAARGSDSEQLAEHAGGTASGADDGGNGDGGDGGEKRTMVGDVHTMYRLAPEATNVNSPLRHVRTRIYFTSESHIHSLVNVLRFAHLHKDQPSDSPFGSSGRQLLSDDAIKAFADCSELDYLTHIVFRMYENKAVPVGSAERFRLEILFSPGAASDPFAAPADPALSAHAHCNPPVARMRMHAQDEDGGITLAELEDMLKPMAMTKKFALSPSSYALAEAGSVTKSSSKASLSGGGGGDNSDSRHGPHGDRQAARRPAGPSGDRKSPSRFGLGSQPSMPFTGDTQAWLGPVDGADA
mmetsp:Transcript_25598/g.75672  ORF Transcript_25598/g.75672 Transcript_25598/m.75672 type:complete len:1449 (-) Transcript_25598:644-4990(-)